MWICKLMNAATNTADDFMAMKWPSTVSTLNAHPETL